MFAWSDESMDWYIRAARYTGYFEALAVRLASYMDSGGTLCDMGCGPGLLSLALSSRAERVTAVDTDGRALEALRRQVRILGKTNIQIEQRDCRDMVGWWDHVAACNFGLPRDIPRLRRLGRRILLIRRAGDGEQSKKEAVAALERLLRQSFDRVLRRDYRLEFGQPFRSRQEAIRFYAHYGLLPPEGREEFLAGRLTSAGGRYPFYDPMPGTTTMFIV